MTRDQLLKPKTFPITLPDDGGTVHARKLKQAEVETIGKDYAGESKVMDGLRFVACRCLTDENGVRLFTDEEQDSAVRELPSDVVMTVATAVLKASGLKTEAAQPGNASAPQS